MLSLLLGVLLRPAFAADTEQEVGGARVYGSARATVAVPTGYVGLASSYSVEGGAQFKDGNKVGIRLAYVPNPPDVYGDATPNHAAGPVFVWGYVLRVAPRLDFEPTVGVGALFGPNPNTGVNKVLPYIQGGLAMRARLPLASGAAVSIGPEIGFVPTILAPYIALSVGGIGKKVSPLTEEGAAPASGQ